MTGSFHNQLSKRRLPPYGRLVLRRHARGHTINLFVYVASPTAWRMVRRREPGTTLVLPLEVDPLALRWPVEGLDIVAIATHDLPFGYDFTRLVQALERDGAKLVVCCPDGPIVRFDRSAPRAS